ncbi:MAG: CtsR family transcriptional regulator [Firmicutes bacterium]|nr:CtsR family transcriptional regulator [Alicyclobacillaceae bacterium]MCL6498371.1 CtsR family transcriptional regulator [Bacillota bacterium]
MARLSDEIEAYLLQLLESSPNRCVEIQRSELAVRFDCVPSQITYVLMTRFTSDRGYLVEGRRGGGGGIRLTRIKTDRQDILEALGGLEAVDQARAQDIVQRAQEAGLVREREANLIKNALRREVLQIDLPERDRLRARLLKALMTAALSAEEV